MAPSYTWHPGADGIAPRWSIPQRLLRDELISSWLVRVALAHGCNPNTLTEVLWPGSRAWTHDLDRGFVSERLTVLSHASGITENALQAATLAPVAGLVSPSRKGSGIWPWVLVLGCRNRLHAGGLQCCPSCFVQGIPYYRIQWRLAWHTACPLHHTLLIDRCSKCLTSLQPGLLQPGDWLPQCHACKVSLTAGQPDQEMVNALAFQSHVDHLVAHLGHYGDVPICLAEWLHVARALLSLVRAASHQKSHVLMDFCGSFGVEASALRPTSLGLPFEYLSTAERARLLAAVWSIMRVGPERFVAEARRVALPSSALSFSPGTAPNCLVELASSLNHRCRHQRSNGKTHHHRTPQAVLQCWLRLQRRVRRNGLA
ncbi:hypothetical protein D3C77_320050 [compost metagenome]